MIPSQYEVSPLVWPMKRKRDVITREPIKYKSRLNIHKKQEFGLNYYDIFLPVIIWIILYLLFILSTIYSWATFKTGYVLVFPHAPIQFDMCMKIPKGIKIYLYIGNNKFHVIKLIKNLNRQK